jgi:integrase
MHVTVFKRRDSKCYWIWYYRNGKRIKESTKATNKKTAQLIADHKEEELLRALGIENPDRLLLSSLIREVISDYRVNKKKSIDDLTARSKHLLSFFSTKNVISDSDTKKREVLVTEVTMDEDFEFSGKDPENEPVELGDVRLIDISEMDIEAYKWWRLEKDIANASINRELAIIKRGFNILKAQKRINYAPRIRMLAEGNVRQGFFEKWELAALLKNLPDRLVPVIKFAYKSGWRKEEILGLKWEMVDLEAWEINLPPALAKNKQGRKFPLVDQELKKMFREMWNNRAHVAEPSPYVFLNELGTDRIKLFRKAWITACKNAGIGEKLFHDFRRTCVRNLVREGTPEKVAMQITGHKTRNVFEAYNIVSIEDMKRALKNQEAGLKKQSAKKPVPSKKGKFFKKEGITKIHDGQAYVIPIEGKEEPEEEAEPRTLQELLAEIKEEKKRKKDSQGSGKDEQEEPKKKH